MNKEIHECKFVKGKISDVTVNTTTKEICCRRCGKRLEDSQVDKNTLIKINKEFRKYL